MKALRMLSEKHFIRKHSIEMPDSELHISDSIRIYLNCDEKNLLIKEKINHLDYFYVWQIFSLAVYRLI